MLFPKALILVKGKVQGYFKN